MPAKRKAHGAIAGGPVQQRLRETLRARAPAPQKETPPVFAVTDHAGIKQSYDSNGFVVIQVLTEEQCHKAIIEIWNVVINRQLWSEKIQVKSLRTGRALDPLVQADREEFIEAVTSPLTPAMRQYFARLWTFHRGFGAPCDPGVFHLTCSWYVRENPDLVAVAQRLTGVTELWVDVNRSIAKLPGEGEVEFLHVDKSQGTLKSPDQPSVQGKVCYTPSRFVAVPGTHTPEAVDALLAQYPYLSKTAPKLGIDFTKPDPLGLIQRQREFHIPQGCVVFWNPKTVHGQVKTPVDAPTEYGAYVGYFPAGSRPEYAAKCGVDERADRLESYRVGQKPRLWPSFDETHDYPNRFKNYPKILKGYIDKMRPGHPSITTRQTKATKAKPSRDVPHVILYPDPDYVPPPLTPLGKMLLGSEPWLL